MGVHDGHRERLRKRFLKRGLADMDEHNALEMLLFYARPRCDTNEIAHVLIKRFGSFAGVMDAPIEELTQIEGIGYISAVLLKMVPEIGAYYIASKAETGNVLNTTELAGAYFLPKFLGKRNEQFYLAALDDKRKVLRCVCLEEEGTVNAVSISLRKIIAEAVGANATGVILAHNHPGGLALPSAEDKTVTAQAYQALRMVKVQLVDHIIVSDGDFVSLADSGFFETLNRDILHF